MTKRDQLRALAERLEAGESGHKVDGEFLRLTAPDDYEEMITGGPCGAPECSTSRDASERVKEELLPGWRWAGLYESSRTPNITVRLLSRVTSKSSAPQLVEGNAPTEPLARMAAICRALAEKENTDDR